MIMERHHKVNMGSHPINQISRGKHPNYKRRDTASSKLDQARPTKSQLGPSWPSGNMARMLLVMVALLLMQVDHIWGRLQQGPVQLAEFSSQNINQLNQMLATSDQQQQQEILISNELTGGQQRHANQPGHYEFDVAPKMDPPTVRKPPYRQTSQTCPGSGLMGGFSPRDTLCGDLNQGRVPLNPLGQLVTDQAYPFEAIKNKTLQFLARALPILKLEYESMPKVARYLSANQLLNPTSLQSPLGLGHFHELNQHLATESGSQGPAGASMGPMPMLERTRRRRSVMGDITVAEMLPNATLLVSSAHSAGRIQSKRMASEQHATGPLMITKDGLRPLAPVNGGVQLVSSSRHGASASVSTSNKNNNNNNNSIQSQPSGLASRWPEAGPQIGGLSANSENNSNNHANGQQVTRDHPEPAGRDSATSKATTVGPAVGRSHANQAAEQPDRRLGVSARPAAPQAADQAQQPQHRLGTTTEPQDEPQQQLTKRHLDNGFQLEARASAGRQEQPDNGGGQSNSPIQGHRPHQSLRAGGAGSSSTPRRRLNCAELGGGVIASTVCQTAAALIEGDKAPAWVQVAKQIGSLYASSASTDQLGSTSWPLLSVLGGAASGPAPIDQLDAKSSGTHVATNKPWSPGGLGSLTSLWGLISPLANLLAGPSVADYAASSRLGGQTKQSAVIDATTATTTTSAPTTATAGPAGQHQNPLSAASLTKMALAGWATTALAGLVEYLAPSVFGSAGRSFARRKKPFEPGETFVDTPASLAALSNHAAKLKLLNGPTGANNLQAKQPATPCPSVEEYISPTFARNYQGAWKYVVQIPHEGYFTQTIQRSSCMRQKCEFTQGVCHEAPRWVSLLVAEIYYPNAVFSQQAPSEPPVQAPSGAAAGSLHQMAAAQSINHLQQVALGHTPQPSGSQQQQAKQILVQDPLQMTDSLNTYNHNLNNVALLSAAASQLGLDPTNLAQMQQLADAHNYQLIQRNGLTNPAQPAAEARASHGHAKAQRGAQQVSGYKYSAISDAHHTHNNHQAQRRHQQQQQQQQAFDQTALDLGSSMSYNEYIRALAAETLRQNPHLTIDDLIKSLQLNTGARKKRDLAENQSQQQVKYQSNHNAVRSRSLPMLLQQQQQPMSSINNQFESSVSLNDLGAAFSAPSTQQQQAYGQSNVNSATTENNQVSQKQQQQQQQAKPSSPSLTLDLMQSNSISAPASSQNEPTGSTGSSSGQAGPLQATSSAAAETLSQECDGHDKIGCYVVRVYYDWFLVNGSCKCWRTSSGSSVNNNGLQQSGSNGNSFLRRIFTG